MRAKVAQKFHPLTISGYVCFSVRSLFVDPMHLLSAEVFAAQVMQQPSEPPQSSIALPPRKTVSYKIVFVGPKGVGKTSLCMAYVRFLSTVATMFTLIASIMRRRPCL